MDGANVVPVDLLRRHKHNVRGGCSSVDLWRTVMFHHGTPVSMNDAFDLRRLINSNVSALYASVFIGTKQGRFPLRLVVMYWLVASHNSYINVDLC